MVHQRLSHTFSVENWENSTKNLPFSGVNIPRAANKRKTRKKDRFSVDGPGQRIAQFNTKHRRLNDELSNQISKQKLLSEHFSREPNFYLIFLDKLHFNLLKLLQIYYWPSAAWCLNCECVKSYKLASKIRLTTI